jgi:hypothetical protein
MEVSSELPLTAESVPSVLFAESAQPVGPQYVADEEFPPDLPVTYDWTLQPASWRASPGALGLVAVTVAVLLIVGSLCVVYWLPRSIPSVLTLRSP